MQQTKTLYLSCSLLGIGILLLGLSGCGNVSQFYGINTIGSNVTPIGEIKPEQDKATVYLRGTVANVVPLLQQRAYQIKDATGKIWVVTNQKNPVQVQDVVKIKGILRYESIPIGGGEFGEVYVEEQQQLERRPGN
jgi:uncharacterized protein YdeI (BOF family)